ncbi:NADH(P)-binding [Cyclobacterium lianum]|uniref:NADH(P)-binding n=1 Tax=Cyclobacterium lianum TaxID=388280 RepID=A0A1M7HPF0_9BACT|nr:NAD(P)-binding oxidoreductase [Cyclobacterium lianum]SHM30364.1 NADH(P)-binding [Cyclobacterium lianum]
MVNHKTVVLGASGATGKHLVSQLLHSGQNVKVIVRPGAKIPDVWSEDENINIIRAEISKTDESSLATLVRNCHAVACCLGHNLTWKGIYGKPRKLVSQAIQLLCKAISLNEPEKPVKLLLMNTAGNQNRDLSEPISFAEKCLIRLIRVVLPPHTDNEAAAEYIRSQIGQSHPFIEWVVVRPDTLTDRKEVSDYVLCPSPSRSAIFNPGKTSRINVGHVMAKLIKEDSFWEKWKGQMPVIYNDEYSS